VRPEVAVDADAAQAARSYEAFLAIPDTDASMRAQALRRLGDLRLAEAEALRAQDGAESPAAVAAARESIAAYQRLLQEQPVADSADTVLYQLARAYENVGESAEALAVLDRLVAEYPQSSHYDEAQFRRGEAFFSAQNYADAGQAYALVLSRGPTSAFHEQALYKRGWSHFKESRDVDSTATFLTLLDRVLVRDGRLRPESELSRPEQELSGDALRALAITFFAGDGPASLEVAVERHGPASYEARLYCALGDLYVEKERYQDGAEAYRAFAQRHPLDAEAPLLMVRATDAYAKGGFTALVLDGKRQLVGQYGPQSEFWRAHAPDIDPRVRLAVQQDLLVLAQHHHALAQKGSATDRDAAVRWYRDYLDGFDGSPQAPATRLLLADLLFEGARYEEAAVEYELAAYSYAANAEAARAGYAAIVAYDKAEAQAAESMRAALRLRGVDAALRFAEAFPEHAEAPAVLTRATRVLFDAGDRPRAEAVAQRVLALGSRADPAQQLVAWTVLAHTYFDAARYADAERAYTELAVRLPAGDPQRAEATERLAASVYRQAEAQQAAGDVNGAVQQFLRVATVAPDSPSGAKAEYDAAALLVNAGQWSEATAVLEQFRSAHPGHELEPQVTRKLAAAYLETGRRHDAAVELERVSANTAEDAEVRRAVLWQAAELYAATDDPASASRAYAAYVERFPAPIEPAIEARQELADLAAAAGDPTSRKSWLEELVVAADAAGSERSRLLAARACLELARPVDQSARSIRLAIPLDRSLAAKKSAMEASLSAYGRAAGYGVAEVTTAADFAMADLYRDLARALLASERPAGLSAEELEQYDLLLEEQAYPFEEKAIGIHERNAGRAREGFYDQWVRESFTALAEMKPARYGRNEILDGPTATEASATEVVQALASARTALDASDAKEAVRAAHAALAVEPTNAAALNLVGVAERRIGNFGESRAAYERAIASDPAFAAPQRNLGVLLDLYLGDAVAALPHYEKYQQLTAGSDPDVGPWLVELRTRLGQVQRTAEVQP
jgi:tetratricopeptide (TPR) repeat protein